MTIWAQFLDPHMEEGMNWHKLSFGLHTHAMAHVYYSTYPSPHLNNLFLKSQFSILCAIRLQDKFSLIHTVQSKHLLHLEECRANRILHGGDITAFYLMKECKQAFKCGCPWWYQHQHSSVNSRENAGLGRGNHQRLGKQYRYGQRELVGPEVSRQRV